MTTVFIALALVFYVIFLIDWKDFRNVLSQGGWAAVCIFGIVGVLIYITLVSPEMGAAPTGMMHH